MKSISEYRDEIEATINSLQFPTDKLEGLYSPIKYALSSGGKRIRPVITMMAADAFGSDTDKALKAAIGLEIFHNFTLLHDDVMDNSEKRRGKPTVFKKFNENTAILSGDTMLTIASQFVSEVSDEILREVLNTFNDMAIKVYEGQQLDMDFESMDSIPQNDYLDMIRYKTGALLGACGKIGALIGGASLKDADKLYEFGVMTGIAFQIQDDWLDSFGDSSTFGKAIGSDINNAKKTFLYITALQENNETSEALKEAFKIPAGELRVKTVKRIYEKLNINEKASKAVNHYSSLALKAINSTSLPEEAKDSFRKLAEKLIGRKK